MFSKVCDAVRRFDCDFAYLMRRFKNDNDDEGEYIGKPQQMDCIPLGMKSDSLRKDLMLQYL
jgi:hypothetical protein